MISETKSATRLWNEADEAQRNRVRLRHLRASAALIEEGFQALSAAGLDITLVGDLPEPAAAAEVAVRHRDQVGRVRRFGPMHYREMVWAMRSVFGDLHPDDADALADVDLWDVQDPHTGEPIHGVTDEQAHWAEGAKVRLQGRATRHLSQYTEAEDD